MPHPIPNEWLVDRAETLLAGDGPYAAALATVLGTVPIPLEHLKTGPKANNDGGFPQVLEGLARAILVVSESMSAADALECHQAVWAWVGKLAPAGDQHELAFVFILPPDAADEFEDGLAAGFGLSKIDPATNGHAVWGCSGSLPELLGLLASIRPMDLIPLRAHRAADAKHAAMARLRATVAADNAAAVRAAAREVLAAFSGCEYLLDVFCRPPSHQHGNLLRSWLNGTVTESITPKEWLEKTKNLAGWLAADQAGNMP